MANVMAAVRFITALIILLIAALVVSTIITTSQKPIQNTSNLNSTTIPATTYTTSTSVSTPSTTSTAPSVPNTTSIYPLGTAPIMIVFGLSKAHFARVALSPIIWFTAPDKTTHPKRYGNALFDALVAFG